MERGSRREGEGRDAREGRRRRGAEEAVWAWMVEGKGSGVECEKGSRGVRNYDCVVLE